MTTRRQFLSGAATGGIAAATLAAFPESIRRALAIPAFNETGTIRDVKHVVILMQENRAFNHYLGTLKGIRGFGDRFTIPQPNGRKVWEQIDGNGNVVLPYHLDETQGNAQRVSGTPHSWDDAHNAWDGGRLYQWPRYKNTASMGYFEEAEIPFQFALANAFTVCDSYHCGIHTGTHANRHFMWEGTNGPAAAGVAFVNNIDYWYSPGPSTEGFQWKTYAERLEDAGVSWLVYENIPDYSHKNPWMCFRQYRKANEALPASHQISTSGSYADQPAYLPSDAVGNPLVKGIANTMPVSSQAEADAGAWLNSFRSDIVNGKLPQVSWIVPPEIYCEHPGPSSPVQGAWFIQQVLDALTAVPEVWSKTVFIVNYDENDGYFDHVPSPSAPSPRGDGTYAGKATLSSDDLSYEYYNHPLPEGLAASTQPSHGPDGNVYGPGPRVPMFVISPWSRGGWVNSQTFDHTSVLRFLETRFGVTHPFIGPFRRAVCGDLTSAFNFVSPNNEQLPTLAGGKTKAEADALRAAQQALPQITPAADRGLPVQVTGVRPSRSLPYALHASACVEPAKNAVKLLFANTGYAGAVFHVYDKLNLTNLPQRYAVEPGKVLEDEWTVSSEGAYDLWVLGPNGFHRSFKGNISVAKAGYSANPEITSGYDAVRGGLYMQIRNGGGSAAHLTVKSNKIYESLVGFGCPVPVFKPMASGFAPIPLVAPLPDFVPAHPLSPVPTTSWQVAVPAHRRVELFWDLGANGCWYDFVVTNDADVGFSRRLAGRVETGRHTVSDPGMGLADAF
ncbi:phosphocholine-specific phospholipase C [Beijerinckia mobilis]|uniref:phosphocholine-specific phospholipase C n=1 Tax=Beijerinckia mobilis TaxID=231434 RepID=UPI0005588A12|nr:phospholipase C, phosphocholine-specific [Beijerinckia mobilis]